MEEIARELDKYNSDITAIQETRWEGAGEIIKDRYTFMYSGEEKRGSNGVGFYIGKKLVNNIIEFKPVDGRIAVLRLKFNTNYISIVNIYAPTEVAEHIVKDNFYEKLSKICEDLPKNDEVIILGDANAQIGKEPYLCEVTGNRKGIIHNETNDNGHRLIQLAASLNMTLQTTKFEHPRKHKVTWRHPAGDIENQIDHIMATKDISRKMVDTRTYRGAQTETDHYLVMAKIDLQRHYNTNKNHKKWDVEQLQKDEVRRKLEET